MLGPLGARRHGEQRAAAEHAAGEVTLQLQLIVTDRKLSEANRHLNLPFIFMPLFWKLIKSQFECAT